MALYQGKGVYWRSCSALLGCDDPPVLALNHVVGGSCQGQADLVFLLDSSGSVRDYNFPKMLKFVKDMAGHFRLGPDDVQIGVDTFADNFQSRISLNRYTSQAQFNKAVDAIPYTGGSTNTAQAIRGMRVSSFSQRAGHRTGVPKLGIILTDGQSHRPKDTEYAARVTKTSGIHLIAVGIGPTVNKKELQVIASDPDSENVFETPSFNALATIRSKLMRTACQQMKTTTPAPKMKTTTPAPSQCTQADIVFVLDASGSVGPVNFNKTLGFVKTLVNAWDIGQDRVRVGVESFATYCYRHISLGSYHSKVGLLAAIDRVAMSGGRTNTDYALWFLRHTMFSPRSGNRKGVPDIGVVITDGDAKNMVTARQEAENARRAGITLFAIGVGDRISVKGLRDIASDPDDSHVFSVGDYSSLAKIKNSFLRQACSG